MFITRTMLLSREDMNTTRAEQGLIYFTISIKYTLWRILHKVICGFLITAVHYAVATLSFFACQKAGAALKKAVPALDSGQQKNRLWLCNTGPESSKVLKHFLKFRAG